MARCLLNAGGILNLCFGLFHIWLGYRIHSLPSQFAPVRGLMEALNAGGTLLIFFLAYASLVQQRSVLGTGLGRSVLVLATLLHLSRAAEELFWFRFNPAIFAACVLVGGLYLWLAVTSGKAAEAATA